LKTSRRTLNYGIYKLRYIMRMWDMDPLDPMFTHKLPFEKDAFTYIDIQASPLVAGMIDGTANLVTRGKGQVLELNPYLYSSDPDYPELKVSWL
jgi:hypothetical protein